MVEYKSGRFYQKPLQARLYARILEAADGAPTDFAIPYFGSRRWIGPEDTPTDAEQDARLAEIRDQLAAGAFPPARGSGRELRLPPGHPPGPSGAGAAAPGGRRSPLRLLTA